ncbi:MFS transporter [Muricomes intestini]|uniref:MFS transporter n=1 Tax=Muricomes intestini TaxID=1796634 RepID=UPI002FE37737
MQKNYRLIAFLAFAMYFLTGTAGIVVGSSLPHLVKMYGAELDKVVLLGSAYAFGRVLTVYVTGRLVENIGPLKVLAGGVILIAMFLVGIPTIVNLYAGMAFAFLGGIGMGAQDTVCPVLLSIAFREHYAGAMSAGQAFFGLGNFTTPFLVGVMLSGKLPFYYPYYILLIVPIVILICIPFTKVNKNIYEKDQIQEEEKVKPLYTKSRIPAYAAIIIGDIAYCAVVNGIMTYTSSFAESLGISSSVSAFMLTVYNVGCFAGALAFVVILRKVKEQTVLLFNSMVALLAIVIMLMIDKVVFYFVGLLIAGFFLGVLFSVYVTIAARIDYQHISRAGSLIAIAGGASDILTPIITGAMVSLWGIGVSFKYVIIMSVISIAAAIVLRMNTREREKM